MFLYFLCFFLLRWWSERGRSGNQEGREWRDKKKESVPFVFFFVLFLFSFCFFSFSFYLLWVVHIFSFFFFFVSFLFVLFFFLYFFCVNPAIAFFCSWIIFFSFFKQGNKEEKKTSQNSIKKKR